MGLMDRFKKNDDLGDDPFGDDSGLNLPPEEGAGNNDDPFGQPSSAPPTRIQPPPRLDYTNPDLNAVTGSPRPRERETEAPVFPGPTQSGTGGGIEKDLQIIIAKLDAVKSELDSLHQRVQKIERIAETDLETAKKQQRTYAHW